MKSGIHNDRQIPVELVKDGANEGTPQDDSEAVGSPWEIVPFAVALPSTMLSMATDLETSAAAATNPLLLMGIENKGIVGTVWFSKSSAMLWFGWGDLVPEDPNRTMLPPDASGGNVPSVISMGPLMVAMPRTNYNRRNQTGIAGGAFSTGDPACSKLIGGGTVANDNNEDEEEMISRQVACRLTTKLGIPIFVSTSLYSGTLPDAIAMLCDDGSSGGGGLIQQRAAALAERTIYNLLKDKVTV